jgi:hypothetical protein
VSTQINVTVDSGGLSARAKQQQEAARLAQLERERTRRTEAEAKAQREAKQIAEGRRPDGQPQFATPPPDISFQDEPAAFRISTGIGHLWIAEEPATYTFTDGVAASTDSAFGGSASLYDYRSVQTGRQQNLRLVPGLASSWTKVAYAEIQHQELPRVIGLTPVFLQVGTRSVRHAQSSNHVTVRFAIPAGGENFIFVFCVTTFWSSVTATPYQVPVSSPSGALTQSYFSSGSGGGDAYYGWTEISSYADYTRVCRTFSCNNSTIREISVPKKLNDVLDKVLVEPRVSVRESPSTPGSGLINGVFYQYPVANWDHFPELGFAGTAEGSGYIFTSRNPSASLSNGAQGFLSEQRDQYSYTPSVFEALNFYQQYAEGRIRDYPNTSKWLLPDQSRGAYESPTIKFPQDLYASPEAYFYSRWPVANQTPDARTWNPQFSRLNLPTPEQTAFRLRANTSKPPLGELTGDIPTPALALIRVWDWNKPDYCRRMCNAFGFSNSDLRP